MLRGRLAFPAVKRVLGVAPGPGISAFLKAVFAEVTRLESPNSSRDSSHRITGTVGFYLPDPALVHAESFLVLEMGCLSYLKMVLC